MSNGVVALLDILAVTLLVIDIWGFRAIVKIVKAWYPNAGERDADVLAAEA